MYIITPASSMDFCSTSRHHWPTCAALSLSFVNDSTGKLRHFSDELVDQPSWRFGISGTWRPTTRFNLSVDYLYGKFQNGFILDDSGNTLNYRHQIAAQLALEF